MPKESKCLTCGKKLTQVGNRPKKYCNSTCRSIAWHREAALAKKKMAEAVKPKKKTPLGALVHLEDLTKQTAGKTKDLTKSSPLVPSNYLLERRKLKSSK